MTNEDKNVNGVEPTADESSSAVELTEPVETEPSLDPRAMFWWDQPTAGWTRKIHVPVFVESIAE